MKIVIGVLFFVYYANGFWWSVKETTTTTTTTISPEQADSIAGADFYFQDKILKHHFVLPGTKYCGPGNKSTGVDDLGRFRNLDICCRDHDMCPDNIPAGEYKHGLHNTARHTKSHCDCDETFHQCLKNVGTPPSRIVGVFFFTFFHIECYRKEHPIIECTRHRRRRCLEYRLNFTATPVYQWFDSPFFKHWVDQFPDDATINNTVLELNALNSNDTSYTTLINTLNTFIDVTNTSSHQSTTSSTGIPTNTINITKNGESNEQNVIDSNITTFSSKKNITMVNNTTPSHLELLNENSTTTNSSTIENSSGSTKNKILNYLNSFLDLFLYP